MFNITELTLGDKLFLWRRRMGFSQDAVAARFEVCSSTYRLWEKDRMKPKGKVDVRVNIEDVTEPEFCALIRRKHGVTQGQLAKELDVSRQWVNYMEFGKEKHDRLVKYWNNKI
jgi:DNA-binding XRE family transcriptional regulator